MMSSEYALITLEVAIKVVVIESSLLLWHPKQKELSNISYCT